MLRRNLLIGGLVAGVFILPSVASAKVQGVCSNCHTMHNSQGGADINATITALIGSGCASCHSDGTSVNNTTDGKSDAPTGAPQVTGTTGGINAAGYFQAGNDSLQHNPSNFAGETEDTISDVPGDALTRSVAAFGGAGVRMDCEDCHTTAGHHTATNYRMLARNGATAGGVSDYNPNAAFPGKRSDLTYNAAGMNNVCAACHGNFHGTAVGNQTDGTDWIRHPTDISLTAYEAATSLATSTFTATDAVVVGTTGATTDMIMCLSCHVAHGGPYADLLSFSYALNYAGTGTRASGCETCHSYGEAGGM